MFAGSLILSSVILIELSWRWQERLSERAVMFHCWFKCFVNLVNNCRDDVIFDETVQVVSFVCSNEALYLQTCNAFSTSFLAKSACPCVLSSIVHDMFHCSRMRQKIVRLFVTRKSATYMSSRIYLTRKPC